MFTFSRQDHVDEKDLKDATQKLENYIEKQNEILFPAMEKRIHFSLANQLHVAPNGYYLFGELWLDSTNQNFIRNIIPIQISTGIK